MSMFGDIMRFIYSDTNFGYCSGVDISSDSSVADYCSGNFFKSLGRAYAILIGDSSFSDYQQSPLLSFLFISYTFVGMIFLLNVLIAVVSDYYVGSFEEQDGLIGETRISILARYFYCEKVIGSSTQNKKIIFRVAIFSFFVLFEIFLIMNVQISYSVSLNLSIVSIFCAIASNISIIAAFKLIFSWNINCSFKKIDNILQWTSEKLFDFSCVFFGIGKDIKDTDAATSTIVRQLIDIVQNSENRIRSELHDIKFRLDLN